jgi:hypothetical protein
VASRGSALHVLSGGSWFRLDISEIDDSKEPRCPTSPFPIFRSLRKAVRGGLSLKAMAGSIGQVWQLWYPSSLSRSSSQPTASCESNQPQKPWYFPESYLADSAGRYASCDA